MAERNFDEEFANDQKEGHTFVLGGFTFHTPPVAPPGAFLNAGRGLNYSINFLRRVVRDDERANLERVLEMPDTTATLVELGPELLSAAMMVLAAGDLGNQEGLKEAMTGLRDVAERAQAHQSHDGPDVAAAQVDEVATWLMEVTIGRPISPASPSSAGAGRTSNGSKATSSRPAKAGKT